MTETRKNIPDWPADMLAEWEPIECLSTREMSETLLVQRKDQTDELAVARCYSKEGFSELPEAEMLQNLSFKGLPAILGTYENEEIFCLVRSYIPGITLTDYMQENDLTQEEIIDICLRLCDQLIYLHGQEPPVIHRDIKPDNVILSPDGQIHLIDLDIARTVNDEEDSDTLCFGTRGYAPPEQYGFAQTDVRSDVFSFGMLLRFLMTGSIRENKNVQIYKPIQRIIDKATAFSPNDRYDDVHQLKKALERANPKAQRRKRLLIAACVIVACGLLALAGYGIYRYVTFDPFGEGHIPAAMLDEDRAADAVDYLKEECGSTGIFDETEDYATVGKLKQALVEVCGLDQTYVYTVPEGLKMPEESDEFFFPWALGDEQHVNKYQLAYCVVKAYWPEVVKDWSDIDEDIAVYPGCLAALNWCEKYGIFTGIHRPFDHSCGEAAIAFANADRVYKALKEKEK